MSEHKAELVTTAEGRQILRLPAAIVNAGAERISALESRAAALDAELAAIRAREAQPDRVERTGAAFEAWSREQVATQQAALKASVDQSTEVGARIAAALEALVQALGKKEMSITFSPTFSPNVAPAKVEKIEVEALVRLPEPRKRTIDVTVDDQGNAKGTVN